jgi:acyl-CoA thioesterase I
MSHHINKALSIFLFVFLLLDCSGSEKPSGDQKEAEQEDASMETAPSGESSRRIVFFGNSLTAAYGLDPSQGFVALIRDRVDSLGLGYQVVNAGLSGETSAGGNDRVDWVLRQPVDIFVLELGGNDGLRGIDPDATYQNLSSIIEKVKKQYPGAAILIAGMEAPPNMGEDFTRKFRQVFSRLAKQHNASLIPFLLEGVGGEPELNLPDGIHPTAEGHRIVAETVWEKLLPLLGTMIE